MKKAIDFIAFALSHAKPECWLAEASLPVPFEKIGTEPWEYLYGTTGTLITSDLLNERYQHFYSRKGWTREAFDNATEDWIGKRACDNQGLIDSFLGTDVTANYCYTTWCTEQGSIHDVDRPYKIGEAMFYRNIEGRMTHCGFVCGFLNGEPLCVEARGIRFGVVVTKMSERPWTHRGLVTKKLQYESNKDIQSLCDDCLNALTCPMQSEIVRTECAFHNAKSDAVADMASLFVMWSWLEKYAEGKRCNFCSDFIWEAKRDFIEEVRARCRNYSDSPFKDSAVGYVNIRTESEE